MSKTTGVKVMEFLSDKGVLRPMNVQWREQSANEIDEDLGYPDSKKAVKVFEQNDMSERKNPEFELWWVSNASNLLDYPSVEQYERTLSVAKNSWEASRSLLGIIPAVIAWKKARDVVKGQGLWPGKDEREVLDRRELDLVAALAAAAPQSGEGKKG